MRLAVRRLHLNGRTSCIVVEGRDEKKRKEWRNRLIVDNVNTVFLNLPGSHRDMMRVAEIIVAFVFFVRHGGSIRRLIGISDFLSCDANAVVFHGWDSEKRTFRLKRKLGPNSDCLSDVSWYDYVYVMLCFWEIELYQRTFEFLSESHGSITNRQA